MREAYSLTTWYRNRQEIMDALAAEGEQYARTVEVKGRDGVKRNFTFTSSVPFWFFTHVDGSGLINEVLPWRQHIWES